MPNAHGPIFCRRQMIGGKIGSCALTCGTMKKSVRFLLGAAYDK